MFDERELKQYDRWGKARPEHSPHGTTDDIRANMVQLKPRKWRQEGNKLIGETDMGELVQFLPTNKILTGTDEQGNPTFKTIA